MASRFSCSRCVMDDSAPGLALDANGICSFCRSYDQTVVPLLAARKRPGHLDEVVTSIKDAGRGRRYDCVVGISGGVDSIYAIRTAHQLGLRILAVHIDNGWNRELAVANIERALKGLQIDLYTWVLDWDSFRDLQLAFLKASTPDCDIPADQAIFAGLYQVAAMFGVRYILSGENKTTEFGMVPAWSQGQSDWLYVKDVHRRHGALPLHRYPRLTLRRFAYYAMIKRIRWVSILDYVDYNKKEAMKQIKEDLGFVAYEGKHGESVYTRFYQGVILPEKFGIDKRKVHLSALVRAGQVSRADALQLLAAPHYDSDQQRLDREFVVRKLGIDQAEFERIMAKDPRRFDEYRSYQKLLLRRLAPAAWLARRLKRL